jgi:hypothetical protein
MPSSLLMPFERDVVYFPEEAVEALGESVRDWYEPELFAMQEPSLSNMRSPRIHPDSDSLEAPYVEAYRFIWLRSFDKPMAVRVEMVCGKYYLSLKVLSEKTLGGQKKLIRSETRELTVYQWSQLTANLEAMEFWGLPTLDDQYRGIYVDGSHYILEGRREDKYHVVDRWSPESGQYLNACLFFLKLAKVSLRKEEVY